METFADQIIAYNSELHYEGELPKGFHLLNPYKEKIAYDISSIFYRKYYSDQHRRRMILGINPGRFGAGMTGIPFTDPKRLIEVCEIPYTGKLLHEPSSVFIYDMILAYGGAQAFYSDFYINSVCPLGFTSIDALGRETNYNYYDNKELQTQMMDFILENLRKLITFNITTEVCFCLGTGANAAFLTKLNKEHSFFKRIVPLEHPRFVMQYKSKSKQTYIEKYVQLLKSIDPQPSF